MDISQPIESPLVTENQRLRSRVDELEAAEVQHRQTEEALSHLRQMLQLVLDTVPQRVFWKDRNSSYLGCNRSFADDAGLDAPGAIVGKTDYELGWNELAGDYRDDDRLVMENDVPKLDYEESQTMPQGALRWLRTSKVPLHNRNGDVIGVLGTYEDISERKRGEEALSAERALLRTMIDNLPDRIYAKDTESRFIICNQATANRMGMANPEQIIGKSDFDFLPRELAAQFHADEQAVMQSGQPLVNHEEPMDSVEGPTRWNLATKVPLLDRHRNVIGVVGIGRDVTEIKKAEREREGLIEDLQHALAEVKTLSGLVPICANCKNIRNDQGYWTQLESYFQTRSWARFSHGICPDCMAKLYPDYHE
jgi:two-component system sensor histidine kinase/response regulator